MSLSSRMCFLVPLYLHSLKIGSMRGTVIVCKLSCSLPNSHARTWLQVAGTLIVLVDSYPKLKESLYSSLVSSAPEVIELEEESEEDENQAPPTIVKEGGSAKGKRKGKKVASSQVSTRSYTKASVQRTAAPTTTVVGSPSATPSAIAPDLVLAPSHSGMTLPSVPRKRKAVAPDTSATSS